MDPGEMLQDAGVLVRIVISSTCQLNNLYEQLLI